MATKTTKDFSLRWLIYKNHTHPNGTSYPSKKDLKLLEFYSQLGSPQKKSSIIPKGKKAIKFTKNGKVE